MVYVTHDQTEAMTLGDRVAVMRAGIIQQVDTPKVLYEDPANLFVAGFIGSPSMNFVPGQLEGDTIQLPFGDAPLGDACVTAAGGQGRPLRARRDRRHPARALRGRGDRGPRRSRPRCRFKATIDVVESMGSELYAYFPVESGGEVESDAARRAGQGRRHGGPAERGGGDAQQVVARLDAQSSARPGQASWSSSLERRRDQALRPRGRRLADERQQRQPQLT